MLIEAQLSWPRVRVVSHLNHFPSRWPSGRQEQLIRPDCFTRSAVNVLFDTYMADNLNGLKGHPKEGF